MNPSSLNSLRVGQSARVSRVTCTAVSPAGDPAAYLIRGAVIALRGRDAGGVYLGDALWD